MALELLNVINRECGSKQQKDTTTKNFFGLNEDGITELGMLVVLCVVGLCLCKEDWG